MFATARQVPSLSGLHARCVSHVQQRLHDVAATIRAHIDNSI